MLAGFDEIDLVGWKVGAETVLAVVAGPQASRRRIPVETVRVSQTGGERPPVAIRVVYLNRGASLVSFDADVARRTDRYVQAAVWTEAQHPRRMHRRCGARQRGKHHGGAIRCAIAPPHAHHRRRGRDVQIAAAKRQAVRGGQATQNHFWFSNAILVLVGQRKHLVRPPARHQEHAFGTHGHQACSGKSRREHRNTESRRQDEVGERRNRRRRRCLCHDDDGEARHEHRRERKPSATTVIHRATRTGVERKRPGNKRLRFATFGRSL